MGQNSNLPFFIMRQGIQKRLLSPLCHIGASMKGVVQIGLECRHQDNSQGSHGQGDDLDGLTWAQHDLGNWSGNGRRRAREKREASCACQLDQGQEMAPVAGEAGG